MELLRKLSSPYVHCFVSIFSEPVSRSSLFSGSGFSSPGLDGQKSESSLEKFKFLRSKEAIPSQKAFQAPREAFRPPEGISSSVQNMKFLLILSFVSRDPDPDAERQRPPLNPDLSLFLFL
jgi:hypothetical protein